MRLRILLCLLAAATASFFGCARPTRALLTSYNREVSDDSAKWGDFRHEQIYATKMDLFLIDGDRFGPTITIGKGEQVDTGGRGFSTRGPTTAAKYKADPKRWPDVAGVIDAGTRIQATELREFGSKALDRSMPYVIGTILDGPHANIRVDLRNVTKYTAGNQIVGPDGLFLEAHSGD